jgi:UDPglucose 6-dehydrogenase
MTSSLGAQNLVIGVIGVGFVGNAVFQAFEKRNLSTVVYDKYKQLGSIEDATNADIAFLCLPTPYNGDNYGYDIGCIKETLTYLSKVKYTGTVVIKSTVLPGTCKSLSEEYSLTIVHNPEFLSARTAVEDFENQSHIVLGFTESCDEFHKNRIQSFYSSQFPNAEISVVGSGESEAMKIFCNSFYATKVQVFNEFYLLSQKLGLDFEQVRQLMLKNNWIMPIHTKVPGTDGQLSFGGLCLPKDTMTVLSMMKKQNSEHRVIEAVVKERNIMRDSPI